MSRNAWNRLRIGAVLVGFASVTVPATVVARSPADEPQKLAGVADSGLPKDLVGTWVLVGTPDKVGEVPAAGGRLKFFTGAHWIITQADPKTGEVIFHHGGHYKLDGDVMAESIEFANPSTASYIGKTHKFRIKVEGDTYTQIGLDNDFTEVWKRAK